MKHVSLVALLFLIGCASLPDDRHARAGARPTDKFGDCWKGEILICDDVPVVHRVVRVPTGKLGYDSKMTRGYRELLKKVGKDAEQLKTEYGSVERGLVALGCHDQAPGPFPAVFRSGDSARDHWCAGQSPDRFRGGVKLYRK